MEFDVVNTPCPGYKTLKRRYTILVFPRVNIKLTQKQNMVKQEKIFCNIELIKNDVLFFKVINRDVIIALPGQDMFQKLDDTLQEKSKCSTDSTSVWQKAQDGHSAKPKRNSFSFVKTIWFKILN